MQHTSQCPGLAVARIQLCSEDPCPEQTFRKNVLYSQGWAEGGRARAGPPRGPCPPQMPRGPRPPLVPPARSATPCFVGSLTSPALTPPVLPTGHRAPVREWTPSVLVARASLVPCPFTLPPGASSWALGGGSLGTWGAVEVQRRPSAGARLAGLGTRSEVRRALRSPVPGGALVTSHLCSLGSRGRRCSTEPSWGWSQDLGPDPGHSGRRANPPPDHPGPSPRPQGAGEV